MTIDYQGLPHSGIRDLTPYKPGKSIEELAKEKGLTDIIKLASNENPLGCSPKALAALKAMSSETLSQYPAPFIHPLMQYLADTLQIHQDKLIISNGSDFIYGLLITSFALHQNKHLLTHDYAFSTYAIQANALGVPVISVPVGDDFIVNVDALIEKSSDKTALLCLANPNNPTGLMIPLDNLYEMLRKIPQPTLVVLDEAYYEFASAEEPYSIIPWLEEFPNLVITRTFSKIYGLAGLRLGYAMANPDIIAILRRLQLPFSVNQAAMASGLAAMQDKAFIQQTLELNKRGMKEMLSGLERLGMDCLPSRCNFITFNCHQDGKLIYEKLLDQGIIVRPLHPYNMNDYIRVSIGTPEQNQRFLSALRGILS